MWPGIAGAGHTFCFAHAWGGRLRAEGLTNESGAGGDVPRQDPHADDGCEAAAYGCQVPPGRRAHGVQLLQLGLLVTFILSSRQTPGRGGEIPACSWDTAIPL